MAGKPLTLENLTAKSRAAATGGKPLPASTDPLNRVAGDVKRFFETNVLDPTKKFAEAAQNLAQGPPLEIFDVVVIGAGLAGLSCADHLLEKSPSLRIVIFDVNDRVGGRTKTDVMTLSGRALSVDSGGMWVGPMHTEMHRLLTRLRITTVPQYIDGKHVYVSGPETRKLYSSDTPPIGMLGSYELQSRVFAFLDALALNVDLVDPSRLPNAARFDAESVASYFERKLWTRAAKDAVSLICWGLYGCEASQVSLLQLLYEIKACGGLKQMMAVREGAQEARVVGGAQQVCEALADSIRVRGGENVKFELSMRVVNVRARKPFNDHAVMVTAQDGRRFATRVVICAGNPSLLLRQVSFSPRLPSRLEQFASRTFRGAYAKMVLIYEQPWWRDAGLSGYANNIKPSADHCVSTVYDYCGMQSANDTRGPNAAGLVCFVCGEAAVIIADQSPEDRRASVLRSLQRLFPEHKEASNPVLYHEFLWNRDLSSMGCPGVVYPPGQFAHLAAPVLLGTPLSFSKDVQARPLMFFASTDVSTEHPGYMEGAVRQGHKMSVMANRALNELAAARRGMVSKETFDDNEEADDQTGTWLSAKGYGVAP